MKNAKRLLAVALFLMSLSSVGTTSACNVFDCMVSPLVSNTCYVTFDNHQPLFKKIAIESPDPFDPKACGVPLRVGANGCHVTVDTRRPPAKIITFERTDPDAPTMYDRLTCPE